MKTVHNIALAGGGLLLLGLVGLILFGRNGYLDYVDLRASHDALVAKNQTAEADNQLLRRRVARLQSDMKYIEYIARKELGMIGGEEIVYKFKRQEETP